MAKLKKDSKGYYRVYEVYQGVTIDMRSKNENALERKVRQRKNEIDEGYDVASGRMRVSTWAYKWLEIYKKGKIVEDNYKIYERNIRNHIIPYIGDRPLGDVMPYEVQEVLNKQEGMSKSHIGHVKDALTSIFREAKANNLITRDPCIGIVEPIGTEGTHRALTKEEEAVMFKVCDNGNRAAPFVYLMYYAGLRPQEVAALTVADIDMKAPCIHITKATEMKKGKRKGTKTKAGNRTVPICNVLHHFLSEWLKSKRKSDFVIVSAKGQPLNSNSARALWKALKRDMSLEMGAKVYRNQIIDSPLADDFVPYNLRHTYCTNLQRAGVPINVAKYLMGHDDISVTAKIYTHFTEDQSENVLKMMNQYHK